MSHALTEQLLAVDDRTAARLYPVPMLDVLAAAHRSSEPCLLSTSVESGGRLHRL